MNNNIKIVTEPTVYLIGKQTIDQSQLDSFLSNHDVSNWTTDTDIAGEKLVEIAGRLCYMSYAKPRPGGNAAYINHILEVGHGSVLEHSVYSLIITGVSRSFTHELVRQRAGMGYSQLSQRFVDESDCEFVEPEIIANDPKLHQLWLESVSNSRAIYEKLSNALLEKLDNISVGTTRRKTAREAARSVLPNATETKIFVTGNARALRHFIEMRGDAAADAEIRKVAIKTMLLLKEDSPNIFGDYTVIDLPEGGQSIQAKYNKV